jgi:hypothetical protein
MQYFDEIAPGFACGGGNSEAFAAFLHALLAAQGDEAELIQSGGVFEVRQQTWKLMDDIGDHHPACANVLQGLVEGLAAACGRRIGVTMAASAAGLAPFVWTIS